MNFAGTQQGIAAAGIPFPFLALVLTIIIEIGAGVLVFTGIQARLGAILLIAFLIPATLVFHNPLVEPDQTTQFLKNLAIMGGLLMIVAVNTVSDLNRERKNDEIEHHSSP